MPRPDTGEPTDAAAVQSGLPPRISALAPFRFPVFRGVWLATSLSNLGGLIQSVGASWLMLEIARSADMVAFVQASTALPIMLFSLVSGAMADNLDRRKVMLGAQVAMLLVAVLLATCAWLGVITPWLLLTLTFALGCGAAFNAPAWQASVGDMVPRDEVPAAIGLNSMGFNIARSVGPAIGGFIVAVVGSAAAFAINAACYVPLIGVLSRWKRPQPPQPLPPESLGTAIEAGVRYVAMSPAIRTVLIRSFVFCAAAGSLMALLPIVAKVLIAGGPTTYGVLLGAFGVGAVVGAFGVSILRQRLSTEAVIQYGGAALSVAIALVAVSTTLAITLPALVVAGAGWVLTLATFNVTVQMAAPRWVVARALSLYQMAAFGGIALGSWLWGVLADADGVGSALLISALVLGGSAALALWLRIAHDDDRNLDPLRHWQAPKTAVPVDARTGPVVITVEWIIAQDDALEFLRAMAERRRIRRRDGARNWRLLRDLVDPELWIERYESPTWLDYVRLNNRMTQDDAIVPERLLALHRGPDAPRVRRMLERPTSWLPAELAHIVPDSHPSPHGPGTSP
jgi:predicted MFS family arabinose efflux permease